MAITDWNNKWIKLCDFARQQDSKASTKVGAIRFYWGDCKRAFVDSIESTLKEGVRTWEGSQPRPGTSTDFLQCIMEKIGFSGNLDQFMKLPFIDWLSFTSAEFRRACMGDHGISDHIPSIRFHPDSHLGLPEEEWDEDGVIDQRFMFTDRAAAAQWTDVHSRQTYGMYRDCRDTLKVSLKYLENDAGTIEELVILGAGSADKDWAVVESLMEGRSQPVRVIICDASFYMLVETFDEFRDNLRANPHLESLLRLELCCFDFTDRGGWSVCKLRRGARRLILMLGGTIGNVDEQRFFDTLRSVTEEGNQVIIGGSFYEEGEDIWACCVSDFQSQYGNSAKLITLNTIHRALDGHDPELGLSGKLKNLEIWPGYASELPGAVSSDVPETVAAVFSYRDSKKPIRLHEEGEVLHDEIILFTSKRYMKNNFISHMESKGFEKIGVADHPSYPQRRFSHIIFRKRESERRGHRSHSVRGS